MSTLLEQAQATPESQQGLVAQASHGIKAVAARQMVTKGLGLVSTLVLARLLTPSDFGIYAIVCFAVTMFGLIADAGLAVALLRQPHEPTIEEESSIFWCQLLLALIQCALIQIFAVPVGSLYHLSSGSILLIRLLSVGSLMAIFITLPMIRLERRLDFGAQAKIEMVQSFAYNFSAILLAMLHMGAWTFAFASLISQVVAIVMLRFFAPFKPKLCLNLSVCKEKLGFGLKFQGTNVMGFLKETVNPLFVGLAAGATAVGYVNFAGTTAAYSLLVTTPFARLYFPIFCRVQHEPELVIKVVQTAVRWNFLIVAGLTCAALPLTDLLVLKVFGAKWLPSVLVLNCLLVSNVVSALAYPLFMLSNAINRADLPLKLSLWTTIFSWVMLPLLLPSMGITGYGAIQIVNQVFTLIFVSRLQKQIPLQIWRNSIKYSLIASVSTFSLVTTVRLLFPQFLNGYIGLLFLFVCGICVYSAISNKLWRGLLFGEAKTFLSSLRAKKSEAPPVQLASVEP